MSDHPDYRRAAALITPQGVRDTLVEMVDIASPTGREGAFADYLVERLRRCGCRAWLQPVSPGRPNAIATLRGSGSGTNLLFTGHMDTSYDGDEDYLQGDGFKPRGIVRDNWVWGLGANNMKSGLASAVVAIEALAHAGAKLHGDVLFGGVVGETEKAPIEEFDSPSQSGYGIGTRYMVTHGVTADCAVLCEPTTLQVCTANMGVTWFKITVGGTMSHSAWSSKPGVVNAIAEMHRLQSMIGEWSEHYTATHEYLGERPNVTVAAIRGGMPWRLSRNPWQCSLYLDVRTVPGTTTDDLKRGLRAVLRAFAEERGCDEPLLDAYVSDPATDIGDTPAITQVMRAAHRRVTGNDAPGIIRRPGADSTHLNRYDVPTLCYGPGGRSHPDSKGRQMHAVGEHVHIDDLHTAAQVYLAAAFAVCGPAQA
ncbi:MAG: M20/M25/M40 family metallo-hydrolase [Proteobacteria bacterium]|nr:M20/M25/M40 family metallo-hydrolase [Burkholderiales bacterium]